MPEPMSYESSTPKINPQQIIDDVITNSGATAKTLEFIPIVEAKDVVRLAVALHNLAVITEGLFKKIQVLESLHKEKE